jgi:transposase
VLLYDLTTTYFEGEMEQNPKAKRGYSRDGRPDCLQLIIALVVTPDGFPLAYEVMNGNTADCSTLRDFLKKIETTYGKARRVWVMDRGIPSEAVLKEMRDPDRQTFYLVGTPKGRINQHEKKWFRRPGRGAPALPALRAPGLAQIYQGQAPSHHGRGIRTRRAW